MDLALRGEQNTRCTRGTPNVMHMETTCPALLSTCRISKQTQLAERGDREKAWKIPLFGTKQPPYLNETGQAGQALSSTGCCTAM